MALVSRARHLLGTADRGRTAPQGRLYWLWTAGGRRGRGPGGGPKIVAFCRPSRSRRPGPPFQVLSFVLFSKLARRMADSFLNRFDSDPREAERKCHDLWRRLVFYFQHHLVRGPEDCAQDVFYRILKNLPESAASYEDVVRFSFGVARNIAKERGREPASMEMPAGV